MEKWPEALCEDFEEVALSDADQSPPADVMMFLVVAHMLAVSGCLWLWL